MALIIEDGTGLEAAESFVSIADADAYHVARGNSSWAALNEAAKEARLRYSATLLSGNYAFRGEQWSCVQGLAFPRTSFTGIPLKIKQAQMELALVSTLNTPITPGVKKEKIDIIEVEYELRSGEQPRYPVVDALLSQFLASGGGRLSTRIGRA